MGNAGLCFTWNTPWVNCTYVDNMFTDLQSSPNTYVNKVINILASILFDLVCAYGTINTKSKFVNHAYRNGF